MRNLHMIHGPMTKVPVRAVAQNRRPQRNSGRGHRGRWHLCVPTRAQTRLVGGQYECAHCPTGGRRTAPRQAVRSVGRSVRRSLDRRRKLRLQKVSLRLLRNPTGPGKRSEKRIILNRGARKKAPAKSGEGLSVYADGLYHDFESFRG